MSKRYCISGRGRNFLLPLRLSVAFHRRPGVRAQRVGPDRLTLTIGPEVFQRAVTPEHDDDTVGMVGLHS